MSREWTAEQRAAQAERIQQIKPWLKATGAKTRAGKARVSMNALKHGLYSTIMDKAAKQANARALKNATKNT